MTVSHHVAGALTSSCCRGRWPQHDHQLVIGCYPGHNGPSSGFKPQKPGQQGTRKQQQRSWGIPTCLHVQLTSANLGNHKCQPAVGLELTTSIFELRRH